MTKRKRAEHRLESRALKADLFTNRKKRDRPALLSGDTLPRYAQLRGQL
jgi:hypothetical protein